MTDFLRNNPIALRHCLLYVFFQEKSVDEAFDDFCETVGCDVIKKEEFQYWFDQFEQGKFDDEKKPVTDMKEIIRNDKHALRVCVLYEYLCAKRDLEKNKHLSRRKKPLPVFEKYKNFCKVIGDNVIEYRKFDFWFYRFANGEFDLDYERDKEQKIYELMDMPLDVMTNILEYLDMRDRLPLEKTSQSLRLFSQDQKVSQSWLGITATLNYATIDFGDEYYISYDNYGTDCVVEFKYKKKVIHDVNVLKQAFQDFKKFLENPKLHLDYLSIGFPFLDSELLGRSIENALKFTHLLHVKDLYFSAQSMKALLNILPSLKPGYLTRIHIESNASLIGEVIEKEQWKQAKYFRLEVRQYTGPLRLFYHFKDFYVSHWCLNIEEVREMKAILLISPDFERCNLHFREFVDPITIRQEFGGPIEGSDEIWHYPIFNSTDYFEILVRKSFMQIVRKKINSPSHIL